MSGALPPLPPLLCAACRGAVAAEAEGVRCPSCPRLFRWREGILDLTTGGPPAAPDYDPSFFESLRRVDETHFWFVCRRERILAALRRHVPDLERRALVDIGCGAGGLLAFLAASGAPVAAGCDASLDGLRVARTRVAAPLLLVDAGRLPPLGPGQGLLGMFDVLEHLDDDQAMLDWAASALGPGGVLALTVPAHPALYDERDAAAGHRRRYAHEGLRRALQHAGLAPRLITHFMAPLLPGLLASRLLGRWLGWGGRTGRERWEAQLRVVPGLNGLLAGLLRLETRLLGDARLPFGSSLLAIAVRP